MNNNRLLKVICSLPILLILLYYLPFIGVCLVLLRTFIYPNDKNKSTSLILIILGIAIIFPKLVNYAINILKLNTPINDVISKIILSSFYLDLLKYSKLLITIGIISFVNSTLVVKVKSKISNQVKEYIIKEQEKEALISEKNDLIMKEKREKAKNSHVVICPYCGESNLLTEKTGRCKYCRKNIE